MGRLTVWLKQHGSTRGDQILIQVTGGLLVAVLVALPVWLLANVSDDDDDESTSTSTTELTMTTQPTSTTTTVPTTRTTTTTQPTTKATVPTTTTRLTTAAEVTTTAQPTTTSATTAQLLDVVTCPAGPDPGQAEVLAAEADLLWKEAAASLNEDAPDWGPFEAVVQRATEALDLDPCNGPARVVRLEARAMLGPMGAVRDDLAFLHHYGIGGSWPSDRARELGLDPL